MNAFPTLPSVWRACLAAGLVVAAIAGCGGGVGTGGTGGNATAYAAGPITGFGSVIVGGVRFDDSAAIVEDSDGSRRLRDELRLGMTVEIDSSAVSTDATGSSASASRIRFESEMVGLVGLVDVADGSFTLLGQRVTVDAATVFDDRLDGGGLAGLRTGQALEVFAVYDTVGGRYRATRLEQSNLAGGLRLRGPVAQLDTNGQTLTVGGNTYSYFGASGIPTNLAAGQFVRLRLGLVTQPVPRWAIQSFGPALLPLGDADGAKVEGLISSFTSVSVFAVSGRPVDASAVGGLAGLGLAAGVRVEVEGTLRGGVLRASKVSVVSDGQVLARGFELIGAITAVNVAQATITLRGLTVSTAGSNLRYQDGTAVDLMVGRNVEVKGVLAADRRTLEATRIRFR